MMHTGIHEDVLQAMLEGGAVREVLVSWLTGLLNNVGLFPNGGLSIDLRHEGIVELALPMQIVTHLGVFQLAGR
jgi:hypothetical protein